MTAEHAPDPRAAIPRGTVLRGRQAGDRHAFLARAEGHGGRGNPANPAHPMPSRPDMLPVVRSAMLDEADPVGSFVRNAESVAAVVHRVAGDGEVDAVLRSIVAQEGIGSAVVSAAPPAVAIGERLRRMGVAVAGYDRTTGPGADLGVTAPTAGLAMTGTLVQRSDVEGGRGASLVPRVHLAVLPVSRIVGSTADVLLDLTGSAMPSNITLITGPSRTGDIEMVLTLGVHGPVRLHILLMP